MPVLKKLFVLIILFCCLQQRGHAQWGNEVVEYSTLIKVEKGKHILEKTFIIQVNNKQSDWITDISIPSGGEKLDILEASILDLKGNTLRKLKKKEIITRSNLSDGAFFEDDFVKEFSLKWNEYPYRVIYRYRRTTEKFMQVADWYPVLYTNVPTRIASLSVEVPRNYQLNMDFPAQFRYQADTMGDSWKYSWEISNVAPIREEAFSQPVTERLSSVTIIPREFSYGLAGSTESWETFGLWQRQMNEGLDLLPLSEQVVVNKLIEGVKDKREIARILYHHLQDHTRYINVAIDLGGMQPYPASYVCTNKYGDCKALTIYMKALLKHAGIESYYTLVYAASNPVKIKAHVPAQQFNHVILCVPLAGDTLWLENTASHLPFNYLGTYTQNRQVLLVSHNSKLINTPALRLEDVQEKTACTYMLNEEGAGELKMVQEVKGKAFEYLKYLQHERSEKEQKEAVEAMLPQKNWEMQEWKINQPHRDTLQLKVQAALKVNNQFRKLGKSLVISPSALEMPKLESPDSRGGDIRISYPVNKQDSVVYQLSFFEKYRAKLPPDVLIESKWGRYVEQYQQAEGQLSQQRSFQLFAGNYSKEEYPAFYAFMESIKEAQKKSVIVLNLL